MVLQSKLVRNGHLNCALRIAAFLRASMAGLSPPRYPNILGLNSGN